MTDFRALCAELVAELEAWESADDGFSSGGTIRSDADYKLAPRARAALSQPEPQGPTDEELMQLLFDDYRGVIEFVCDAEEEAHVMADSHVKFARVVLARWGRPAIEPVPVAERLPGPEDCDATGCCWAIGRRGDWVCIHVLGRSWSNPIYTHWLSYHALPVPQQEANND